jgi:hypothetical protein
VSDTLDLLLQAMRTRRLASETHDTIISDWLIELAEELEAKAAAIEGYEKSLDIFANCYKTV